MRKFPLDLAPALPSVLPASVLAVLVYGTLLRVVSLHTLCTLRFPSESEAGAFSAAFGRLGSCLTFVNVAFAAWIALEGFAARSDRGDFRLARQVGRFLALAYVVGLQWGVLAAPDYWSIAMNR